jgi:hypothetical protein
MRRSVVAQQLTFCEVALAQLAECDYTWSTGSFRQRAELWGHDCNRLCPITRVEACDILATVGEIDRTVERPAWAFLKDADFRAPVAKGA